MSNTLILSANQNIKSFKKNINKNIQAKDFHKNCLEFISWTKEHPYQKKNVELLKILSSAIENTNYEDLKVLIHCGKFSRYVFEQNYKQLAIELPIVLDCAITNDCIDAGKELCELIIYLMEVVTTLPSESKIIFLRDVVYFSRQIDDCDMEVRTSIKIAEIFQSNNAFQSAYRILSEAETNARERDNLNLVAKLHVAAGAVSYSEQDFEYATKYFFSAIGLYSSLGIEPPIDVLSNFATSLMDIGQLKHAAEIYNDILSNNIETELIQEIYLNLMICYRDLNEWEMVQDIFDKIDISYFEKEKPETLINLYLIFAKTYYILKEYSKSMDYLLLTVERIEKDIENIYRLHYRRGYREKYVKRIKNILLNILNESSEVFISEKNNSILHVFIFLNMNASSDSISLNNWVNYISTSDNISQSDKDKLFEIYERLKGIGIPFLNYYHEKYDDPFEDYGADGLGTSRIWNDFNIIVNRLVQKYALFSPYQEANAMKKSNNLECLVKYNNYSFLFSNVFNGQILVTYLSSKGIKQIELPMEPYIEFRKSMFNYQRKYCSLNEFKQSLNNIVNIYCNKFEEIIESFEINSTVINIENTILKIIPVNAIFLNSSKFRELLKETNFKFYNSPIISEYKGFKKEIKNYLGIFEPFKELPLLRPELSLSNKYKMFESVSIRNIVEGVDLTKFQEADFIHFASHGFPISNYNDPIFATMSGPFSDKSLSFAEIQTKFNKFDYQLVLLSACDSSDSLNSAFNKTYDTNELISFPLIFLLNQKSVVISFNWPIIDIVPYVFSSLFLEIYQIEQDFYRTFNKTQLSLYELTVENLLRILENIEDENIRTQKMYLFKKMEKSMCPFNDFYILGAITFSSLITH